MSSALNHNDYVVCCKIFSRLYRVNHIVVVRHKMLGIIIKRIERREQDSVWLCGDNSASTAAIGIGKVPIKNIIGKVCWHFRAHR